MEDKYKQVTDIINELAEQNPFITKAQIAKAKSMYNGDTRSIDVIRAELEAYSNEIMAQGLKAKEDQKLEVIWTFDEKERYSYKLVVKEQGKSIEDSTHALYVGEKLQLEAIHYTYINGEIHDEYESDVSNDMKTIWTVYDNIIGTEICEICGNLYLRF